MAMNTLLRCCVVACVALSATPASGQTYAEIEAARGICEAYGFEFGGEGFAECVMRTAENLHREAMDQQERDSEHRPGEGEPLAGNDALGHPWEGSWEGFAVMPIPFGECKFVFRNPMRLEVTFANTLVSGEANGRGEMVLTAPLTGEIAADGNWHAEGTGYVANAWAMRFWFGGNIGSGEGIWRETNYGCRGTLTLTRH
jgi:hypothetical protein